MKISQFSWVAVLGLAIVVAGCGVDQAGKPNSVAPKAPTVDTIAPKSAEPTADQAAVIDADSDIDVSTIGGEAQTDASASAAAESVNVQSAGDVEAGAAAPVVAAPASAAAQGSGNVAPSGDAASAGGNQ